MGLRTAPALHGDANLTRLGVSESRACLQNPSGVAIPATRTGMARRTELTEEEMERVRAKLREFVQEMGSQSAARAKLGVGQQTISKILLGKMNPSLAMVRRLAFAMRISEYEIRTGRPDPIGVRLDSLPGWADAEREALARFPLASPDAIRAVGSLRSPTPPGRITTEFVVNMALAWGTGEPSLQPAPPHRSPVGRSLPSRKGVAEPEGGFDSSR